MYNINIFFYSIKLQNYKTTKNYKSYKTLKTLEQKPNTILTEVFVDLLSMLDNKWVARFCSHYKHVKVRVVKIANSRLQVLQGSLLFTFARCPHSLIHMHTLVYSFILQRRFCL